MGGKWAVLVLLGALAAPGAPQRRLDLFGCAENFDIRSDTIIRTQDSQVLGARFMNESEVSSRDECVRHCCQTTDCNVFIYEEKTPGSCYLFDCGPTDDFKCKFHTHGHYVSGVMTVNRQVAELESQIKLSKHEQELTGLRRKGAPAGQTKPVTTSTSTKPPTTTATTRATPTQVFAVTTVRRCSRYQFECRTSGECIAIYNACDGIPQCADGSDEGPELACPTPPTTRPPPPPPPIPPVAPARSGGQLEGPLSQQTWTPQIQKQQLPNYPLKNGQAPNQEVPLQDPNKYYGENEYRGQQQWPQQPPPFRQAVPQTSQIQTNFHRPGPFEASEYDNSQNSHIFNHKTTGLLAEQDNINNGYNGRAAPNYYPNPDYHQPEVPVQWPRPQEPTLDHARNNLVQHSMEDELKMRAQQPPEAPRVPYNPPQSSDYYYEEGGQQHGVFHKHPLTPQNLPPSDSQAAQPAMQIPATVPTLPPSTNDQEKTTEHPYEDAHKHGHYTGNPSQKKALGHKNLDAEAFQMPDGTAAKPGGAYLSLSIGLLVTALLAALISCRLRAVRRRLRRGGKSNLAHDADFLVNGMYL
ncbi:low-density lipoprotein receptor-related protein 11 isoform X2 [Neocloeon triangulifer]|uniref:low-density lipoprotein receptor-related protein 11 isoform X2 n=1 Tax=Neocloeon triangulifer TaxID=2078957 RepID=UPI00286F7E84|nr:low-density lipoprotein receptor-related protein 11 isoform X2 [Neocloeon triangulifer]